MNTTGCDQETNSLSTYAERIAELSPGPLCPWRGVYPTLIAAGCDQYLSEDVDIHVGCL